MFSTKAVTTGSRARQAGRLIAFSPALQTTHRAICILYIQNRPTQCTVHGRVKKKKVGYNTGPGPAQYMLCELCKGVSNILLKLQVTL